MLKVLFSIAGIVPVLLFCAYASAFNPGSVDYYIGQEDGRMEGRQQGLEEGQAIGRQEGRTTGQEEGRSEVRQKVGDAIGGTGGGGSSGAYKYSGIPGKWTGPPQARGRQPRIKKDTGPNPKYHLDRLPAGTNSDEAVWVKMDDGRLMMIDPLQTQRLK